MTDDNIHQAIGLAGQSGLKVVQREMPADLETPVSAFLKLRNHGARILLESVESGITLGRYSFIGMKPDSRITIDSENLIIQNGDSPTKICHPSGGTPFTSLRQMLRLLKSETPSGQPHLLGGLVGYISYDFIHFFEKVPRSTDNSLGLPLAAFYLIDTLLVFDHVQRRLKLMCLTADQAAANRRLDAILDYLHAPLSLPDQGSSSLSGNNLVSNYTEQEFVDTVISVKDHITAGDIYQMVLSQRLQGTTDSDPFMIYRALRMLNPSPYMYYLDFDDMRLIGSSPEAMVKLQDGLATVRPIAGTRPRGKDEEDDQRLAEELIKDEKERAEHVMLVDLGRNDLGRCCRIGSVKVTELMQIEKYSHVMHMTSNVVGQLRPELDQFDLFRATFPAGTVTGAPKIRSMQLIAEYEHAQRGPYAGAVGYFSSSGDMDWCITIRTILMQGRKYYLQAGAGIVADSVPEREYQETRDKLAALKKAIEMAEGGI